MRVRVPKQYLTGTLCLLPAYEAVMRRTLPLLLAGITLSGWAQTGWPNYGNDGGGTRYSAARQIDRTNVARLQPVWTYRTGALEEKTELVKRAAFEATPILVGTP